MTNFNFLKQTFPQLFNHATQAEKLIFTDGRASCFYSRFTLEQGVIWLYENEPYLKLPESDNLSTLIYEQTFQENLSPGLFQKLRLIIKMGNKAVHDTREIKSKDALFINQELWHFLYWLTRYYAPNGKALSNLKYDENLIETQTSKTLTIKQLEQLETRLNQAEKLKEIAEIKAQQTEEELKRLQTELNLIKQVNSTVGDDHDYNEQETRQYFIDLLLKETGWNLEETNIKEYAVTGMPNQTGKGKVDYVLWDVNGLPLAIIEAKRTFKDAKDGKHQAKLYADCLEKQFNQRPLIFYTNGYDHYFWDDLNYPPRQISGFLKRSELTRIIHRRQHKTSLNLTRINREIVNRSYQIEAIKRLGEDLENQKRKGLFVMATGTGKTRTAIALVDLLIKTGWVKKVLFLADRNSLITQAKRAFTTHLPNENIVNLKEVNPAEAVHASVVLSTYPTLLNRIDLIIENQRLFSAGHFDLIIVDEAHRSIYQKYRHIFNYFDSLLIGLTATPRSEVDRDTYKLFELPPEVPTFAYELDDGIKDGYLVPPFGIKVPFKFMNKGIKYSELSPEEQQEYDEKFRDDETGLLPESVDAVALNNWLFNINTVDQALQILMEQGLKIAGGDKLGKTIIFAKNHNHANFIVERFDYNYPHLKGKFCQVIDSHDNYAQSLLDDFSDAKKEPTIAVSVDMLDTGVDVPEVVNLVFFKPVYSRVKFNQMIGRGTRLCPNLFGIDQDKQEFYIFDLCSNFEYFDQNIEEKESKLPESLSTKLTKFRLQLSQNLPKDNPLKQELLNNLHQQIATLEKNNFLVRPHLAIVEEFSDRNRWENLKGEDLKVIRENLVTLPTTLPQEKREVKEFDLLCLKIELSIIKPDHNIINLRDKVRDICANLETKITIPMVQEQIKLITEIQTELWWENVTIEMIEAIRIKLRNLMQFVDKAQQKVVITDFLDELGELEATEIKINTTGFSPYQYRKKVEAYIKANQDHIAINKLKRNLPLTNTDLQELERMLFQPSGGENKAQFKQVFGENIDLKKFIRELVGLDRNTAKQAFSQYLENGQFTANQIRFIENIIDYLTRNGIMDLGLLYEAPFTNFHSAGIDGLFNPQEADRLIDIIESFNLDREVS
jgi:type I restriction enzyme, R subunit